MDSVSFVVQREAWMERGSCKGNPLLFFGTYDYDDPDYDQRREPGLRARVQEAKTVCHGCPVEADCLDWALRTELEHGVAGGLTGTERIKIIKRSKAQQRRLSNGNS